MFISDFYSVNLPVLKLAEVYFGKKICGVIRRVLVHVACVGVQFQNFKQIDRLEDRRK